jgi:hypothetical protein
MQTLNLTSHRRAAVAGLVALALGAGATGCGSSAQSAGGHASPSAGTPTAYKTPGADPVAVPPVTDLRLETGPPSHQITETIVAFYRAAWQDNASQACALFSSAGQSGFLQAAHVSFPQSVQAGASCEHAMQIYNATLGVSASTAQDNDPSFTPDSLDQVGVGGIVVHGDRATAVAPTNVVELINPKQISLVHSGKRWLIDSSRSLNKSNLSQILARARAEGELKPKRGKR